MFNNAGFFKGNLLQRVTQYFGMIHSNVCNNRKHRVNHIGRIKSPSQSNFNDCHINAVARKIVKRHRYRNFKKWGLYLFNEWPNAIYELNHIVLIGLFSVDAYALRKLFQVRGCIQTRVISWRLQNGRDHVACTPLSIGSCNVYWSEFFVGVVQGFA